MPEMLSGGTVSAMGGVLIGKQKMSPPDNALENDAHAAQGLERDGTERLNVGGIKITLRPMVTTRSEGVWTPVGLQTEVSLGLVYVGV